MQLYLCLCSYSFLLYHVWNFYSNTGTKQALWSIVSALTHTRVFWSFGFYPKCAERADCRKEAADSHSEDARSVSKALTRIVKGPWPLTSTPNTLTPTAFPHSFRTGQLHAPVCPASALTRWLSNKGWRDIQWIDKRDGWEQAGLKWNAFWGNAVLLWSHA